MNALGPIVRARRLRQLSLVVLAVCALIASFGGRAAPTRIIAEYDVSRNGMLVARIHESFERQGNTYVIRSETRGAGILALARRANLVAISRGKVLPGGLQPEQFERTRGNDAATRASAEFDWNGRELTLLHDGKRETVPLVAGTQDRLSAMYQFMFMGLNGRSQLDLVVTNGAKLDRYTYDLRASEATDTPLGALRSVRLIRRREAGDSGAEIWLATERAQLPARVIVQETDGDRLEQLLTRLDIVD